MNKAASNTRKNHGFSKQQHSAERTISSDKRASRNLMENMRLYPPGPGRHRIKLQFENLLHFQEELEYWGLDSNQVEPCCWMWVSWSFVNLSTIYFFLFFQDLYPGLRMLVSCFESLASCVRQKTANFENVHLYGHFFKGPSDGLGTHHRQKMKEKLHRKHNPNQSKKFPFSNKIQLSNFDKLFSA